ncbi:hypothetical protein [Futiania mangrovi]|uniref:DUF1129 domain-containing protein n=1 Tax=Futiania mangrovi TaxID=2959716 RepID=A0A9J6PBA6_9PROT|nr:hypothetical protein [Futiania mangrovii]MCP1337412.1 DUF1129 domain-containing protein [Futiania mangrovii]
MVYDRRRVSRYDRRFYMGVAGIFALLTLFGIVSCLLYGVSEMRLLVAFAGGWYLVYTMDLIERRFRRSADGIFWRRWFSFRGSAGLPEEDEEQAGRGDKARPAH